MPDGCSGYDSRDYAHGVGHVRKVYGYDSASLIPANIVYMIYDITIITPSSLWKSL